MLLFFFYFKSYHLNLVIIFWNTLYVATLPTAFFLKNLQSCLGWLTTIIANE